MQKAWAVLGDVVQNLHQRTVAYTSLRRLERVVSQVRDENLGGGETMAFVLKIIDWILRIMPLYRIARDIAKQVVVTVEALADNEELKGYEKKVKALEMFEQYLSDKGYKTPRWIYSLINWFIDFTVDQLNKRFGKRWIDYLDEVSKFIDKL